MGNGLDPYVGFLHEAAPYKAPLVYDLQEPFRWLVDVAVLRALENREFKKSDFILTENYNLRLKPQSTRRLIERVNAEFISKVEYKGKSWEWRGIVQQKAGELADFLRGKTRVLNFAQPSPTVDRDDTAELREKVLAMSYAEWKKMGFSKGTLHELKVKASSDGAFKVYAPVLMRLSS